METRLVIWDFNVQFWTASQDIKQNPEKHETKGVWARVRVVTKEDKRIFQKGNDKYKAFFAGPLLRTHKRSDPKPRKEKKSIRALDRLQIFINVNINR